jgi:hypothetical protein
MIFEDVEENRCFFMFFLVNHWFHGLLVDGPRLGCICPLVVGGSLGAASARRLRVVFFAALKTMVESIGKKLQVNI